MPAVRMGGAEAVVAELLDVHDGVFSVRQLHKLTKVPASEGDVICPDDGAIVVR